MNAMSSLLHTPRRLRRLVTAGIASLAAIAVVLLGVPAAQAGPLLAAPMPNGPFTIQVHKYEQPEQLGDPATGLPLDPAVLPATDPVANATFIAKRVPGIDLATNAGQSAAAALTPVEAETRVSAEPVAATDTTDGFGNATLRDLPRGLYLVEETVVPNGYVRSASFLVALPLTNPDTRDGWLTEVHVYPKNAKVGIGLSVNDENAVQLGDEVCWRSASDIPHQQTIGGYTVRNALARHVALKGRLSDVRVGISGQPAGTLREGDDYTFVETSLPDGRWRFDVVFTPAGLRKLEAHPGGQVTVDYCTTIEGEGEHTNEATVLIDGMSGGVSDTATTKWGPLSILVHEQGKPSKVIKGARFKLYLTAEDALAGRNPIVIDGQDTWETDVDGMLTIHGLRFSNFVNGLERDENDPLFRFYYVAPVSFPDGYTGSMRPLQTTVHSTSEAEVVVVEVWKDDADAQTGGKADASGPGASSTSSSRASSDSSSAGSASAKGAGSEASGSADSDGGLSTTGTRIAGIGVLGALLIAGAAILLARRRQEREATEQ